MEAEFKRQKVGPSPQPGEVTRKISPFAAQFAERIHAQLRRDGVSMPEWPRDLGNPKNSAARTTLYNKYKKYHEAIFESLRAAELLSDPEKRRSLKDALTFKGICEDMCPDWERIQRIVEGGVSSEEKVQGPDGQKWFDPTRMVKKLGRSSAGQEEPTPMDVRTISALKRTTDYLLGELLQREEDLPRLHNFLWDRLRAIRKDTAYDTSTRTPEEWQLYCYVFETIARFHAVALHLLSRKGVGLDGFSHAQEIEQLQKTLKSLQEAYDDCHTRGIVCPNEAEFRAYFLIVFAHETFPMDNLLRWKDRPWYNSPHMKIAKSIVNGLQGFKDAKGLNNDSKYRSLGSGVSPAGFTAVFDLIEEPSVSYQMACVAETQFYELRLNNLRAVIRAFARKRDAPKDITPSVLNSYLRFDTEEEVVEFAKECGLEFETKPGSSFGVLDAEAAHVILVSRKKSVKEPIKLHQHSAAIVEAKRNGGQSLNEIFRKPIWKVTGGQQPNQGQTGPVRNGNHANEGMQMDTSGPDQLSEADNEALQYNGPMTSDGDDMFVSNPQYDSYVVAKKRQNEIQEKQQLKEREAKLAKEIETLKQKRQQQQQPISSSPFARATWTPASNTTQQPAFGAAKASSFGAPSITTNATPFGAPTFGGPSTTGNGPAFGAPAFGAPSTITQPSNGAVKTSAPSNPFKPAVNPFKPATTSPTTTQQPTTAPLVNPFKPAAEATSKPVPSNVFAPSATPQQATPNNAFAPSAATAPLRTKGFSVLGATTKQTPQPESVGSVFDNRPQLASTNPFQKLMPGAAATPPTQNGTPAESGTAAKSTTTMTPASSVFSSVPSTTSTPASTFFPKTTSTPSSQPASIFQTPAASSTPATNDTSIFTNLDKPQAAPGVSVQDWAAPPTSKPPPPPATPLSNKKVTIEDVADGYLLPNKVPTKPASPPKGILKSTAPAPTPSIPAAPVASAFNPTPLAAKPAAPKKVVDPMAGLTKWYVCGDGGLLGDFTDFFVTTILEKTFQQFQEHEAARIKKEEDDASWAAARAAMTQRLSVKYFNRWRETARELSQTRILREGAAKRLAYQEELVKKQRERKKEEARAARRKAAEKELMEKERDANFSATADLERMVRSQQRSKHATEEALLASGIFSGMRDEKMAARRVVNGNKQTLDTSQPESIASSLDSRDMAPPKKEGPKTQQVREKFSKSASQRRSDSLSSSIGTSISNNNFRHSMPVNGRSSLMVRPNEPRVTNFSFSTRKRSADTSDDEGEHFSKRKTIQSTRPLHWELRARGMVCMPNGRWLPESMALAMQGGKRYPGIGDCGLGPGKPDPVSDTEVEPTNDKAPHENTTPARDQLSFEQQKRQSKLEALAKKFGFPASRKTYSAAATPRNYTPAASASSPGSSAGKRKRDDQDHDSPPFHAKKQYTHPSHQPQLDEDEETRLRIEDTQRMLREMNEMMDTLDEERPVYQQDLRVGEPPVFFGEEDV